MFECCLCVTCGKPLTQLRPLVIEGKNVQFEKVQISHPGAITQVLMNLISNALVHAFSDQSERLTYYLQ